MLAANSRCIGGTQLGKAAIGEAPSPAQGPSLSSAPSELPRQAAPWERANRCPLPRSLGRTKPWPQANKLSQDGISSTAIGLGKIGHQ